MILADDMQIESIRMSYIGLWKSIYRKKQLEEVTIFQESQGMSKEYLTETAKQAYGSRNKNGKWWLAQEGQAQSTVIALIAMSFIPCVRSWSHFLFFIRLLLMVWGGFWLIITIALGSSS
jgi:hypothetical protein